MLLKHLVFNDGEGKKDKYAWKRLLENQDAKTNTTPTAKLIPNLKMVKMNRKYEIVFQVRLNGLVLKSSK